MVLCGGFVFWFGFYFFFSRSVKDTEYSATSATWCFAQFQNRLKRMSGRRECEMYSQLFLKCEK